MLRPMMEKTPYELLKGRKPNVSHFRAFGCKCFVHKNGKRNIGKFDERSDEAVFLGYSNHSKAYRFFNKNTLCVEESIHVIFDETNMLKNVQEDDQDDFEIGLVRNHDFDDEEMVKLKGTNTVFQEPETNNPEAQNENIEEEPVGENEEANEETVTNVPQEVPVR